MHGCGPAAIVEGFVMFEREVSIIAVRRPSGDMVFYPLSENRHKGGILRVAECRNGDPEQQAAESYVRRLMESLDYVGVIALELFDVAGELLANEFAPRVHNSGHWTIEGAETCQFENHLRAILDLPLGSTAARGYSGMVNFIGGLASREQVLSLGCHLHLYDKTPRKGRKVGHATVRATMCGIMRRYCKNWPCWPKAPTIRKKKNEGSKTILSPAVNVEMDIIILKNP